MSPSAMVFLDDDSKSRRSSASKLASKSSAHRAAKRTSTHAHDHGASILDGRHKRVWKACERCRMKKTKCDGESPCKRCKDDGLVCTAGTRKKTEFKQLPRGYAEVLENTQYALIATVQKLYSMVRNHEEWDLGEPDLNDRGQPVIHNIAEKLGCIRPSPDLPHIFPEGAEDFTDLQNQLLAAQAEEQAKKGTMGDKTKSSPSETSPPGLSRTDRASSSESDHSEFSQDYHQMLWERAQQQSHQHRVPPPQMPKARPAMAARSSIDSSRTVPSPVFTDFSGTTLQQQSPLFDSMSAGTTDSPFSPWSGGDDFLAPANMLDLTAQFMNQQLLASAQDTIRPGILDCSQPPPQQSQLPLDLMQEQMDSIIYGAPDFDRMMV